VAGGAVAVLVLAAGAPWEPAALSALDAASGVVVLRRCMDVTDLLAHAAAGDAQVAVVAGQAPGLDHDAIARLRRDGVEPVVVVPEGHPDAPERVRRLGVRHAVVPAQLASLPGVVRLAAAELAPVAKDPARADVGAPAPPATSSGHSIAVWGPPGAPGRTTLALGITGELAARGRRPLLVDADPWGGAVAQRLGVLDEVSGLLAASRVVARGDDPVTDPSVVRRVAAFDVVTGLPRSDRWSEVGPEVVDAFLGAGRDVVLDTGFSLEDDQASDFGGRRGRNALTQAATAGADLLVVVGTADPVGLARLARALDDLRERESGQPVHVVLNRWRARLGIDLAEARRLLAGFGDVAAFHVVPDDALAADRALVTGRTYVEAGPSPLSRSFAPLVEALIPESRDEATAPAPRIRLRRGAAGRRR
jgi:MinD-like ATPase involved in chromosome partitioning or flagellar assembly